MRTNIHFDHISISYYYVGNVSNKMCREIKINILCSVNSSKILAFKA